MLQIFLHDFLEKGIPNDFRLAKTIRIKSLESVLPFISSWIYSLYTKVKPEVFQTAYRKASMIARRGRSFLEYEFVILTATYNLVSYDEPWLISEINYMKYILIEKGVFKGKDNYTVQNHANDFLRYSFSRSFLALYSLQEPQPKKVDEDDLYV